SNSSSLPAEDPAGAWRARALSGRGRRHPPGAPDPPSGAAARLVHTPSALAAAHPRGRATADRVITNRLAPPGHGVLPPPPADVEEPGPREAIAVSLAAHGGGDHATEHGA